MSVNKALPASRRGRKTKNHGSA